MLRVQDLTYAVRGRNILQKLSFELSLGDCVALVGKNGSGKTTTMNILAGCLNPTSGTLFREGRMGYAMDVAPIYSDMSVIDYLIFIGRLRKINPNDLLGAVERVMDILGLETVANRFIGRLSKGYVQRVGLAQAIIHQPDILILDEPTSGLDPEQQKHFSQFMCQFLPACLVVFSTHRMEEVSQWGTRVLVLSEGSIREVSIKEVSHAVGLDLI